MVLQQLAYSPSSQNQRVKGFEVPGDEYPRTFSSDNLLDDIGEIQNLIMAAYRQIFNEQQLLTSNRLPALESQLKMGQITVKGFIRGLLLSETFRKRNYDTNNNYRFARMCLQRVLGREPYSDRELLSWSIVIGTKGIAGFVNELLESQEYIDNFGEHVLPYQRRRILPQRLQGEVTFAHMPRYAEDHLIQLKALGNNFELGYEPRDYLRSSQLSPIRWQWQQPPYSPLARRIGASITIFGASAAGLILVAVILSWFGVLSI